MDMPLKGKRGLLFRRLQEVEALLKGSEVELSGTAFNSTEVNAPVQLVVGKDVIVKSTRLTDKISQSNGHACKVNGRWFHRDELESPELSVSNSDLRIVIGTTKLLEEQPDLADRISKMIEDAYAAVGGHPLMLQSQPVHKRLEMSEGGDARGDGVMNTNRVLHVAFIGRNVVGCVSSSKTTTWNANMGHWGLLVVDPKMQGKGIATALIATAQARVMEHNTGIQIEYDFFPENEHSLKLEAMYAKRGYDVVMKFSKGEVTDGEFRIAHKKFSVEEQNRGRRRALLAERAEITALLGQAQFASSSGETCNAAKRQVRTFFDTLGAFVKARDLEPLRGGAGGVKHLYQLIVVDVIPKFAFVLDLTSGCVKEGVEPDAEITISMTGENMIAWWKKALDWQAAFWRGAVVMTSTLEPEGPPGNWWSDAVNELTELFGEMPEVAS